MKKFFAVIALGGVLVACNDDKASETTTDSTTNVTVDTAKPVVIDTTTTMIMDTVKPATADTTKK